MTPKIIPIREVRDKLNAVSPTFCLAKWAQSTIHLTTGHTHSCHHPATHKIPLVELQDNPAALHNTRHKMAVRREMLDGVQTKECDYCWRIENLGEDHISDRTFKSSDPWAMSKWDEVIASGVGADFFPSYIEINFENTCNFRCLYCNSEVSSRWMEDIRRGPYQLVHQSYNSIAELAANDKMPIGPHEDNPYVTAFWKWWPELKTRLISFRITGGEPLLSKNTWKIMDDLIDNPAPELDFAINTNMSVPPAIMKKFISRLADLRGCVKNITVFTSCEGEGPDQEFVRDGMVMPVFWENVENLLEACPNVLVCYMSTVNVFSVQTFHTMVARVLEQRKRFNLPKGRNRVGLSINYLRHPNFLALPVLKKESLNRAMNLWKSSIAELSSLSNHGRNRLYDREEEAWRRMITWAIETPEDLAAKEDLLAFLPQVCERRGLDISRAEWVLANV